jgi:hypothetical protein
VWIALAFGLSRGARAPEITGTPSRVEVIWMASRGDAASLRRHVDLTDILYQRDGEIIAFVVRSGYLDRFK